MCSRGCPVAPERPKVVISMTLDYSRNSIGSSDTLFILFLSYLWWDYRRTKSRKQLVFLSIPFPNGSTARQLWSVDYDWSVFYIKIPLGCYRVHMPIFHVYIYPWSVRDNKHLLYRIGLFYHLNIKSLFVKIITTIKKIIRCHLSAYNGKYVIVITTDRGYRKKPRCLFSVYTNLSSILSFFTE